MPGKLYIVSTPIGNLRDISPRITQALCDCDYVLAEDTRVTIKLMSHLGLSKRLVSCHDFNEEQRAQLLEKSAQMNETVALVSDAGTPLVSDPGFRIVRKAIELDIEVIPIPGPSAFLLALIGSGLPCERFVFEGFLPDRPAWAKKRVVELMDERRTMIFYVAPHKIKKTLDMVAQIFGKERPACVARELTKLYEEFLRGTLAELIERLQEWQPRGECVLVVGGNLDVRAAITDEDEIVQAIQEQIKSGKRMAEVASFVAQKFGLKKSDVYKLALEQPSETDDDDG
ncbi:MAG TPA: 16S rRNA (cytidine(1402)-2'-O)-methyltransferase [Planktothrix sp.]|jgi:16S rRNA (cytidine1402-2'-O)-methyltransferase